MNDANATQPAWVDQADSLPQQSGPRPYGMATEDGSFGGYPQSPYPSVVDAQADDKVPVVPAAGAGTGPLPRVSPSNGTRTLTWGDLSPEVQDVLTNTFGITSKTAVLPTSATSSATKGAVQRFLDWAATKEGDDWLNFGKIGLGIMAGALIGGGLLTPAAVVGGGIAAWLALTNRDDWAFRTLVELAWEGLKKLGATRLVRRAVEVGKAAYVKAGHGLHDATAPARRALTAAELARRAFQRLGSGDLDAAGYAKAIGKPVEKLDAFDYQGMLSQDLRARFALLAEKIDNTDLKDPAALTLLHDSITFEGRHATEFRSDIRNDAPLGVAAAQLAWLRRIGRHIERSRNLDEVRGLLQEVADHPEYGVSGRIRKVLPGRLGEIKSQGRQLSGPVYGPAAAGSLRSIGVRPNSTATIRLDQLPTGLLNGQGATGPVVPGSASIPSATRGSTPRPSDQPTQTPPPKQRAMAE